MRFKKFLLFVVVPLLVIGLLSLLLAPFVIVTGLRLWSARAAQQGRLRIEFGKIDAPLMRPVVIQNLRIESEPDTPFRIHIESPRIEVALNLWAVINGARGQALRTLIADEISIDIRRNHEGNSPRFSWQTLADLRADNFRLSDLQLHFENGDTVVDLQDATLSGSQIEAGVFGAAEISIVSPLFRKAFSQLRGTTSWQENRLSIGALTLTKGLDIDAINIDLSQIGESRIGLELNLDAFGGKLRTSVSSDDHGDVRTWDVAGSASGLSLSQLSEALDFTDCVAGSLHACKFTFRGETTNFWQATAAIWAEVTGLTWRDRTADTIIIGASLYNRQVQIEQVFVQQHENQLTLTGESTLPEKLSDWLNPEFRGDISASIDDLGDFARLFGASPSDFAGKIKIEGKVSAKERKLGGQLMASGNSLTVFRAPVESLDLKLSLRESELEISNIELCRKNDVFRGQANVDLEHGGSYSGQFSVLIGDATEYVNLLPEPLQSVRMSGNLSADWMATGTESAHSGTVHIRGHGLRLVGSTTLPFDADVEGEYSPDGLFFHQFNLSNPHASIGAFVALTRDYLFLQSLHLDLNGNSKLIGNIFLPVSLSKLRTHDWLSSLNDDPNFDVDITLNPLDIAELARAISTKPNMSGQASGSLQIQGPITSVSGKSMLHLHDFVFANEPSFSADAEMQLNGGTTQGKTSLLAQGSSPVEVDWVVPYQVEKREASYAVKTGTGFSATVNFPTLLVAKVPNYLSQRLFVDGILSGRISFSGSWPDAELAGDAQLINARFLGGPTLSTKLVFQGQKASVDFVRIVKDHTPYEARGELDFHALTDISLELLPSTSMVVLTPLNSEDCISKIEFLPAGVASSRRERIGELDLHTNLFSGEWRISLAEKNVDDPIEILLQGTPERTYPICRTLDASGHTLVLGMARPFP